jgi:hypothetical protein
LNTFDLVISLLNNKTANVEEKKEREWVERSKGITGPF